MYCKVHRPVNTPGVSDNKGKCVQLVEYLSKELKEERPYYDNFFSQKEDYVTPLTVMHHMDNNHRTLKRNDDKFYMLTINPSGEEQQHLIEKVTGEKTGEFPELSPEQQKEVLAEMKRLTRECMDEYARNFYREKIRSGDDLVWYGRVETERHYKGDDPEVKGKYSINSLVYWVTYVHNVVYSFYRSMIYCYINSTQRCAGSIVIDIIPTNGADKRKFFPFAPYFPVTNVIKRYFYPYFPAIIGIKGYSFPYFPYLSGIMKIKTALYSLFSRLDWHKTVVFPCLGEIYEGIRSLSWEIPVT